MRIEEELKVFEYFRCHISSCFHFIKIYIYLYSITSLINDIKIDDKKNTTNKK